MVFASDGKIKLLSQWWDWNNNNVGNGWKRIAIQIENLIPNEHFIDEHESYLFCIENL